MKPTNQNDYPWNTKLRLTIDKNSTKSLSEALRILEKHFKAVGNTEYKEDGDVYY